MGDVTQMNEYRPARRRQRASVTRGQGRIVVQGTSRTVPNAADAADILKRAGRAVGAMDQWRDIAQNCYEYCLPHRNPYRFSPGETKMELVVDSTAIESAYHFAGEVQQALIPTEQQWIKLVAGVEVEPEFVAELEKELEHWTAVIFQALHNSNFAVAAHESLLDLCIGTGALRCCVGEAGEDLHFEAETLSNLAVEEGPRGTIENTYRKKCVKNHLIERMWPDAELPDELRTEIANSRDGVNEFTEAIYYDATFMCFRECIVWNKGVKVIRERASLESEWLIYRWSATAGETIGRGVAMMAYQDIVTLNRIVRLSLANAELAVAGVYLGIDDGILNPNTVKLAPGAIIPVDEKDSLSELPVSRQFDLSQLIISELRERIESFFFNDKLPPQDGPRRTATELLMRNERLARKIGPAFGRLYREMVAPLVRKVIFNLQQIGKLPKELRVNGHIVDLQYVGPLSQAQKQDDIRATSSAIETVSGLLGPQMVMAGFKVEDIPEWFAEQFGMPRELVRTPKEREAIKQAAAAYAQKQLAAQSGGDQQDGAVPAGAADATQAPAGGGVQLG